MIDLDEDAGRKLREALAAHPAAEGRSVRVVVSGLGCGGPDLAIGLDEQREGDEVFTEQGVRFLLTREVRRQLGVFTRVAIEHSEERGFVVRPKVARGLALRSSCDSRADDRLQQP